MTFLENAKKEHRISNENHTIQDLCPSDLGYEQKVKCKAIIGSEENEKDYICRRCWEREMPNTEPKVEVIPQSEVDAYNKGHADGVAQGLTDAWELADKFNNMAMSEIIKVLGIDISREEVFDAVYPQEALAKLKAYEEAQIEVGDVVDVYGDIGVVSSLGTDKDRYHVLFNDGITNIYGKTIPIKKTGKHIDISSILEQIGE